MQVYMHALVQDIARTFYLFCLDHEVCVQRQSDLKYLMQ
jgi:hypothetical protein